MRRALFFTWFSLAAFAADDGWTKVQALKSGTEVRVYQHDARQPINARLDDTLEDKIIISVKNEQRAIAKDEIDRLDARPQHNGSRVTRETKTSTTNPTTEPTITGVPSRPNVPGQSQSSNVSIGSKPNFETVYRRLGSAK